MSGVRADKWLWAARFFKTRQLAAKACELGRILHQNQPIKPSRELKTGDFLRITTPGGEFEIRVENLSDTRGSAAIAQALYTETEESKKRRKEAAEARRAMSQIEVLPDIRPSSRDRKALNRLRGRDWN